MDGLSAAASIIAVVQISGQVFDLCRTYYLEVKEARKDIQQLRDEVTSLQDDLASVADLAEGPGSAEPSILGLIAKLEPGQGRKKMKQFGIRALKWPFTSKEVEKLLVIIGRHKATFNLALTTDDIAIKNDVARLNDGVAGLQFGQRGREIYQWLSSPDPSSNHNAACKKRQATTGEWFVGSEQFEEWQRSSNSFLWLHGNAGCGKTILCSTIIEQVKSRYESNSAVGIAYFYFDFNDTEKQQHEKVIRSLIEQLSLQSVKSMETLNKLYTDRQDGRQQPTADALASVPQNTLGDFQQTFIFLDALDECKERKELLGLLKNLVDWKIEELHVLATSRRLTDIEETLESLLTGQVCIPSAAVNADIHVHLCERLRNDVKLRKFPAKMHSEIEKTLMEGANGMYAATLMLESYAISMKTTVNIAFKILQWLGYSARPLRIKEVAEVITVDIDRQQVRTESRLFESRDVLAICSSLVSTVAVATTDYEGFPYEEEELRLAHFSVKEYLVSDQIRIGPVSQFDIRQCAEDRMAQTCLIYLLQFKEPTLLTPDNIDGFPLARYAANYWPRHARAATEDADQVNHLSIKLFQSKRDAFLNWIRLYDALTELMLTTVDTAAPRFKRLQGGGGGHEATVKLLLDCGASVKAEDGYQVTSLQVASTRGHEAIVKLLLDSGADINAKHDRFGTALLVASQHGYGAIAKLLLDSGANVNAQGGFYGTALQAASIGGNEAVVKLLLDSGANVKAEGGYHCTALQAASVKGHEAIVKLLLDSRIDVNAQVQGRLDVDSGEYGDYGTAL
ncbi:MAG: hypothetical protein M1818_006345 [Claussenomyces sp. TS43310]|nr:MAG: hypothetical protein M1818_006345 [Claussenomyces sp. TS43310]